MKNNYFIFFFSIIFFTELYAESLFIQSKNISIDKNKEVSIFENEVVIKTQEQSTIKADYAEYDKKNGYLKLKNNITAKDVKNNIIKTNYAEYNEKTKVLISKGETSIITTDNYIIEGSNIIFDNNLNFIKSDQKTNIEDNDQNKIILDNFEYQTSNNIFKSVGFIKITDKQGNSSEFSQVYIDPKKKEILGTDIKAFLNQENFKINKKNKPRIFANSMKILKDESSFNKGIFTVCDYRKEDKCPPWTIQAKKILHDNKKKTIYYDNAVVKVYDVPIFYFPKLSHPDPTVERRSGFLPPLLSDTKNLGTGLSIPYYWAISRDKDFTINNKLFINENPIFLGEYRHAFENSYLIFDGGYTEGYKKTSATKKSGEKSHFFSEFVKSFSGKKESQNNLVVKTQDVSNDKYLKLYRIKSNLVDYNQDTIENSINFTHENEDFFLGLNTSVFETLKEGYNDKYEYILPEISFDKNLLTNSILGNLDLQTNLKIHNYDTNKTEKFLVNNFDFNFKDINFNSGLRGKLFGKIKNVNYDTKNVKNFKEDTTNEFFGALGYLSQIDLFKKYSNGRIDTLSPKLLLRHAPGHMRKQSSGSRLNPESIFLLDRLDDNNNFENGTSAIIGFDYEIDNNDKKFNFSAGQNISQKENQNMPSVTSLDEKLSDFVGVASLNMNEKVKLDYNFSLDQNYSDLNYNELGSTINLEQIKFDFRYLQEKKHIGNQEYFKTKIDLNRSDKGLFSFETKRNLITNSAEFYNLSYEYINDCLRAGLVFRREFYNDSELEPENSLMFKITLVPFGNINSPSFNQ